MFRILLLCATIAPALLVDASQCCPSDQIIRNRKDGSFVCWTPGTHNTSSPVTLKCAEAMARITPEDYDFHVNSAGQMIIPLPNQIVEYSPDDFCLGTVWIKTGNETNTTDAALFCYETGANNNIDGDVFGYCMVVSTIFLLITATIYIALPELRDLQGKSIINFCISLAIGLGILAAMKLIAYSDMDLCATRGFLAYFFIIASFFWMNAISIQILFSIRRPTISTYGWREFIYYAVYAWGCPVILTITMAVINFMPGEHLKPGIGLNHCWFFNTKQQWYYMYSVMSVLIAVNILIFFYISAHLWRHSFSSSHVKALRYKFLMTLRMSVVMGVAWIFEMIGSVTKSHIVWEILDLVNSLQGVLIFLVLVVFRRKVIKSMHKNGWLDCISTTVEKYLAVGEDEEDVVEHTIGVNLDEPKITNNR